MFFNFFKRTKECAVCHVTSDTTTLFGFDPTNRGGFPELGKTESVCVHHLKEKWLPYLDQYKHKSVCMLPLKGWNSYSYSPLSEVQDWGVSKEEIVVMTDFLLKKTDKNCDQCKNDAVFFVSEKLLNSDVVMRYKEPIFDGENISSFCPNHFVDRIVQEFQKNNSKIDEINVPYKEEDGVYMFGAY